jgi:uncharacterized protein (UPF0335 family)
MSGVVNSERLQRFFERIEKLEEERKAISDDIKDIFSEAKGVGYDTKTMRKVLALRKMDAADRAEQQTLLDVYMHALGMIDRVEARIASGESIRGAAKAEGMTSSTAHRRVSQKRANVENGTPSETAVSDPPGGGEQDGGNTLGSAQPDAAADDLALPPHLDRRRAMVAA